MWRLTFVWPRWIRWKGYASTSWFSVTVASGSALVFARSSNAFHFFHTSVSIISGEYLSTIESYLLMFPGDLGHHVTQRPNGSLLDFAESCSFRRALHTFTSVHVAALFREFIKQLNNFLSAVGLPLSLWPVPSTCRPRTDSMP